MRGTSIVLVGLLGASLAGGGCAAREPEVAATAATSARTPLDEHRSLGTPVEVGDLVVWPVHTDAPLDVGEFRTLQEAQAAGTAAVRELGAAPAAAEAVAAPDGTVALNANATVNRLVVANDGDLPLLVCAGTIVRGGNQDRQIGQDVVVAAHSSLEVDAFCVEPGRWNAVREGADTDGEFAVLDAVATKDVRASGQYLADQGRVWDEVAEQRAAFGNPATAARIGDAGVELGVPAANGGGAGGGGSVRLGLERHAAAEVAAEPEATIRVVRALSIELDGGTTFVDVLEKAHPEKKAAREKTVAAIRDHFRGLAAHGDAPVGFAYAVRGEPQGVRVFAHPRLLERNLESFATSMAVEAEPVAAADAGFAGMDVNLDPTGEIVVPAAEETVPRPEPAAAGPPRKCTAADVVAMVRAIESGGGAAATRSLASNENRILVNGAGFNGSCVLRGKDGKEVRLTEDWARR